MNTSVIEVRIWGKSVGAVAPDPTSGAYVFRYDDAWLRSGTELAPLMMRLAARPPSFVFPGLPDSYKRLPGLLSDALPDAFGNALIDAWMAKLGISKGSVTALDRLAYMGKRGMGALEFRPAKGSLRESAEPIAMQHLVEAARNVVHGHIANDKHARAALANIIRVGTSAGGARAKAVVAWNETTDELRSGQFDAAPGFSHWLLKFDGMGKDFELGLSGGYGRIEYAYCLMATAAGVAMSRCRLLEENGRAHFMTRRFDRDGNMKHHVQSLCAMQHLDYMLRHVHGYEQLFLTLRDLDLGHDAAEQVFRRMAFNVMARNCDDHTKNHAFLLREGEGWSLAPAYDITHAHNPKGEWTAEHLMSVNGRFDGITRGDLIEVGDRFGVPNFSKVIDEVATAIGRWREFGEKAGLPASRIEEIEQEFVLLKAESRLGRKRLRLEPK